MRPESEQMDGMADVVGTKDKAIEFEVGEAEKQRVAGANGVDGRETAVGQKRVVMAVDHGDGVGKEKGVHASGLLRGDTDRDETGPVAARRTAAGADVVEQPAGYGNSLEGGVWERLRLVNSGGRSEKGNVGDGGGVEGGTGLGSTRLGGIERDEVGDGEHLRGENAVEAGQAERASAVEEVGDVGLLESRLAGEQSTRETAAINAAKQLQT